MKRIWAAIWLLVMIAAVSMLDNLVSWLPAVGIAGGLGYLIGRGQEP